MEQGTFRADGVTYTYRGDEIKIERLIFATEVADLGFWVVHTVDVDEFCDSIRKACEGLSGPRIAKVSDNASQSTGVGIVGWKPMTDAQKRIRDEHLAAEAALAEKKLAHADRKARETLRDLLEGYPDEAERLGWKKQ